MLLRRCEGPACAAGCHWVHCAAGQHLHQACQAHTYCAPPGRFFEDYKKNENKEVKVDEIAGREAAMKVIQAAMVGAQGLWSGSRMSPELPAT